MEDCKKIKVKCDSSLYGVDEIELDCWLHQMDNETFSNELLYIQEHYKQLYDCVLLNIFLSYLKSPKWCIWNEELNNFLRVDFTKKEELHLYIGVPTIDIMYHENKVVFGLSFWKNNRLSIEHGFCAVFCQNELLLIADSDFENILYYWEFYYIYSNKHIFGVFKVQSKFYS